MYAVRIFVLNSVELAVYFASRKRQVRYTEQQNKSVCSTVGAVLYFRRPLSGTLPWQHTVRSRVCTNLIYKIVTIT
jgi:hypothetical protein